MLSPYAELGRYNSGGPTGVSAASLLRPRYPSLPPGAGGYQPPSEIAPSYKPLALPPSLLSFATGGAGAAAAPAAPGASAAAAPAAPAGVDVGHLDYSQDPILLKARALAKAQDADAQAAALASQRQNLIRYGDPALVAQVLGKKAGDTGKAAADNPFSTVAELGRWNSRQNVGITENANNNNLFYSTARARDLALQGEDYQRQQSKTGSELQDVLTQIAQSVLAERRQSQQMVLQEEEAAYGRALQEAEAQQYYANIAAAAASTTPTDNGNNGNGNSGGSAPFAASHPSLLSLAGSPTRGQAWLGGLGRGAWS